MMLWNVRHAGSPQSVDGISDEEIGEGLFSGQWEATDEVRGENERQWQPIELHPHFAQAARDLEDAVPPKPEEDTHLDMNPLIDVCLVLLIFFILTTTYDEMRKELPPPPPGKDEENVKGSKPMTEKELKKLTFSVKIVPGEPESVFLVDGAATVRKDLKSAFEKRIKENNSTTMALEIQPGIVWKSVVAVQDAAAGAGVTEILRVERIGKATQP